MNLRVCTTSGLTIQDSPIIALSDERLEQNGVKLFIKRDDLIHPTITGNKYRKLKYNLAAFKAGGFQNLLTFGGAFSNHIHAVAAAGELLGISTIGIIRGERSHPLSSTLLFAEQKGMTLHFVSRTDYRRKEWLIDRFSAEYPNVFILPEGGANDLALKGCAELVTEIQTQLPFQPDYYGVACGTGTTLAGMAGAIRPDSTLLGITVLKHPDLLEELKNVFPTEGGVLKQPNIVMDSTYHHGGYAKWTPMLIDFINDFKTRHHIALDPIYTGKLFYALFDLIRKGYFKIGSRIVAIHTGGLQGIEGFNVLNKNKISEG